MIAAVDRQRFAPSGERSRSVAEWPQQSAPPNAVVLEARPGIVPQVRSRGSIHYRDYDSMVDGYVWIVRGLDFVDGFEAMRFADRLAKLEGRPVFVQGLP